MYCMRVPGPRPDTDLSYHIEANLICDIPNKTSGPKDSRSVFTQYPFSCGKQGLLNAHS